MIEIIVNKIYQKIKFILIELSMQVKKVKVYFKGIVIQLFFGYKMIYSICFFLFIYYDVLVNYRNVIVNVVLLDIFKLICYNFLLIVVSFLYVWKFNNMICYY